MYGSSSASDPPMRWISRGRRRLGHVQHVVDRHDADQHAGSVGHGQRGPVVLPEHRDGRLLIVGGRQGDEPPVHQVGDLAIERRQQELANADVVDQQALLVDHVDDVQRLAVLPVQPHVIQHFANRPLFPDGHVVRRHQTADRLFGIAEQGHRDGAFLWSQQRQQLAGGFRRQLLEEQCPVIRRHVVQQRRHVLLRHRLQQRLLRVLREVLEHGRGVLARQHAEDDHLVFQAQCRQERRDIAGVPVAEHVAKPRVVAGAKHRGEFLGGPRLVSDRRDSIVALGTVELLFHLFQRCSDDVVVMHVGTDALHGVEPQAVNQVEVARSERRWVGAEVIRVGPSAAVIHDQPHVEGLGLVGALPGLAE